MVFVNFPFIPVSMKPVVRFRCLSVLALAGTALLGNPSDLCAQGTPRAQLAEDNPPPAPAAPAEPVRKATIVDDEEKPTPAPAPTPPPKAQVAPGENAPADAPPPNSKVKPAAAPEVSPARAPRAKTHEDDLFDYCELLFSKGDNTLALRQYEEYLKVFPQGKYYEEVRFKMGEAHYRAQSWDLALMEFDSYLRDFPSGRNRAIVFYHAGESHRTLASGRQLAPEEKAAKMQLADQAYRGTLQTTRTGPYAAYAAFRLASFAYNAAATNESRYKDAIRWFTLAAAQAPREQGAIRYASLFFKGRSCKFTGATKEAAAAFEELVRVKPGNDYYEKALLELANLDMEAGHQEEAMKKFDMLAKESAAAETRAESMVNAGMIHADAGRAEEAIARFEEAAKMNGAPLAAARARFGLVFAYFKQKAYDKVIGAWRGIGDYQSLDENSRARLLLIVGTCYAAIDQHLRAVEIFRILEDTLQDREEALEGGYKRLVSLFKLNDTNLPQMAEDYVERWKARKADSDFMDKAWLVRAAYYFNRRIWQESANSYQKVRESKLEEGKLATYLYQRGFAETSCGEKEAVITLGKFIEKFPQDERIPNAYLQRGLAARKTEDYTGALRDFEIVQERFSKSDVAESAAYNVAKVIGLKQDLPGMVASFERLLKDFPKTKVAPEAWFWIGTGLFKQQKYKESLEGLRTARETDAKSYYTDATLMIISALTQQKDIEGLMPEVDNYLKGTQEKKIPVEIMRWLGRTVFERQDYRAASRYLSPVVDYSNPRETSAELWAALGESQVENGSWESGIVALDHLLAQEERPGVKAKAHLLNGRAYLALGKLEEATTSAEAGLDIDKETLLSAQLGILMGDIAMASNRTVEAISSYGRVKNTWEDPTLTPLSMFKLIAAYEKSGDPANLSKAEGVKKDLAKRFPRFQAPLAKAP